MKPNVGMVYPVYAPVNVYTPGTSITYSTGGVVAEARSATLTWERADGEFYGDDVLLDTDNGIRAYTLDFEPTGVSDTVRAALLGETLASSEYTITDATAPDVGFGYVRVMRDNASGTTATVYEAWWFYKIKFGINSEEARTKERNIEWRTPTLNGRGMGVLLSSGDTQSFAKHETFSTLTAAKAWLKTLAGIT